MSFGTVLRNKASTGFITHGYIMQVTTQCLWREVYYNICLNFSHIAMSILNKMKQSCLRHSVQCTPELHLTRCSFLHSSLVVGRFDLQIDAMQRFSSRLNAFLSRPASREVRECMKELGPATWVLPSSVFFPNRAQAKLIQKLSPMPIGKNYISKSCVDHKMKRPRDGILEVEINDRSFPLRTYSMTLSTA